MKESSRALALAALQRWQRKGAFADEIMAGALARSSLGPNDRAFALELCYGLLRNLTLLDFWIARLRREAIEPTIRDLLRLGLYQILLLETAAHAAVFETVELARPRARPIVNAILRRAVREKAALLAAADEQPLQVRFSHPEFLIAKWTRQFGAADALALCRWNNRPAPLYARVNQLKITVAEFLERYPGRSLLPEKANFVRLNEALPAIEGGECYIQDISTAISCELLAPLPGEMVLDACAAPGGKTAYLAEMMANQGRIFACDRDKARLRRLRENLVRLGVTNARIVHCDWRDPGSIRAAGFANQSFDRILIDVPCTNTGVMRRRVDVRWHLRPEAFRKMQEQQLAILRAVVPLLKPTGSLVYSTCSLEPEENEEVVRRFIRDHPEFRLTRSEQSLPFRDQIDGAFAARLELRSE